MAKKRTNEINLGNLTANHDKIALEESWQRDDPEVRTPDRIWYEQIPCRGGAFIGLYSLDPLILQLYTPRVKNAKVVWEAIKDIPGSRADFHFDGEAVLFFPLEAIHMVAHLAGARKRRRLSEEHKARLAESNKTHRFKPKSYASNGEENGADLGVHS